MNATVPVQISAWVVAGCVAAWFLYVLARTGPLGMVVDYAAAALGALLAGLLTSLATGGVFSPPVKGHQPPDQWWLTIPAAFVGAIVIDLVIRGVFRVRHTP